MAYQIFPYFAFRTPLLPFNEQFLVCDRNTLFNHFSNPHIQEAFFLASPVLYREIEKVISAEISNQKEIDRIIDSFVRYFSRMHTRCTPFGLFAGCGTGKVTESEETDILLNDTCQRKTRLDMLFQYALYDTMIRMPGVKEKIRYYPNSSLYVLGNKYRYVESVNTPTGVIYRLSETMKSIYLRKVLKAATKGADMEVLINSLTNETISKEDASEFINQLIDAQVIVGELNRAITGSDFFDRMISLIESINEQSSLLNLLKEIRSALDKADHDRNGIDTYQHIVSLVKQTNILYQEKFLFQVDTIVKPLNASLGIKVVEELKSTFVFLNRTQMS